MTSSSSSSSSSSTSACSSSLSIVSQFLTKDNCTDLLTTLAQTNATRLTQTVRWPNSSESTESQLQLVTVGESWEFSCDLRMSTAAACFFVRLTENSSARSNVLTLEPLVDIADNTNDPKRRVQRIESMLHCNVGDAIVVPAGNVLCGLRSSIAGVEDLFAIVIRDSLVQCTWSHFDELPLLAKERIVTFLDIDTALALGCASRACQALVSSNSVWHDFALLQFGEEACQPVLPQTTWRERFKQMVVARQHSARENVSARPDARHFSISPHDIMREWVETEQQFIKHFVFADRRAHELVHRGFVWFDCLQQLFPIQERFAADIKRMFVEHMQFKRQCQFAMREVPPALIESLVCRWIARAIAMYRDPTWCANIPEAFRVNQRTRNLSPALFDFPVEGAAQPDVPGLSFVVLVSRVMRYSLLLRELRGRSKVPFVREMIALAEQSLQFTKNLPPLTNLEEMCNKLAPKRPLSDFLALTTAELRSWLILSRPVHLMLARGALLVIGIGTDADKVNADSRDFSLSLQGATLHFEGDELSVTSATGKTHKFNGVSSEFVMEMQKQLRTEATPATALLSDDNDDKEFDGKIK